MKKTLSTLALFICFTVFGQKIEVLNFGTFHMKYTPDEYKLKFEENDKSKAETYQIAKMLAEFKPTIICVEIVPTKNEELNDDYANFLKNKNYKTKFGGEVTLIAYELAKIAGVKKIYGIDEKETAPYNYRIGEELKKPVDSITSKRYFNNAIKEFSAIDDWSVLDKLKYLNTKEAQQSLINLNADILTYNSTQGNFEGADEASKYYRRNLRMFSNLNQIPVTENDRIFIIMGATHTAFFNEFLERSPKYKSVEVTQYLK
jgi:hypothetical protein